MVTKQKPKDKQGQRFLVEVASISSPKILEPPAKVGEPITFETNVLGFPVGETVEFSFYEPHKLHEDAIDTASGATKEEDRGVTAEWTLDYESKKDDLDGATFVCVAKVKDYLAISEPFTVVEPFETTLEDDEGNPVPNTKVTLWSERGENVSASSDEDGKVSTLVPPGNYRLVVGEIPPPAEPPDSPDDDDDDDDDDEDDQGAIFGNADGS